MDKVFPLQNLPRSPPLHRDYEDRQLRKARLTQVLAFRLFLVMMVVVVVVMMLLLWVVVVEGFLGGGYGRWRITGAPTLPTCWKQRKLSLTSN